MSSFRVPRIGGLELAQKMRSAQPDLKVLFISGYSEKPEALLSQLETSSDFGFLQKPFATEELARRLRQILDSPGGPNEVAAASAPRG